MLARDLKFIVDRLIGHTCESYTPAEVPKACAYESYTGAEVLKAYPYDSYTGAEVLRAYSYESYASAEVLKAYAYESYTSAKVLQAYSRESKMSIDSAWKVNMDGHLWGICACVAASGDEAGPKAAVAGFGSRKGP